MSLIKPKSIEEFINDFKSDFGILSFSETKLIEKQYMFGFCYYFAKILQEAYPKGEICYVFPKNHFVYRYEEKLYDIKGEVTDERLMLDEIRCEVIPLTTEYFIGELFILFFIKAFKHNDFPEQIVLAQERHLVYGKKIGTRGFSVLPYIIYKMKTTGEDNVDPNDEALKWCYFFKTGISGPQMKEEIKRFCDIAKTFIEESKREAIPLTTEHFIKEKDESPVEIGSLSDI